MSRNLYVVLLVAVLGSQTGCHCCSCWPCGKTWCGSQCGECYWCEWFSPPPDCCDPCDNCGAFLGPNNRFLRRGVFAAHEGALGPYGDGGYPGRSPEAVEGRPTEELPPGQTSDAGYYNELGQQVSFDGPVDSPRTVRTLGRPPRSRVIAR